MNKTELLKRIGIVLKLVCRDGKERYYLNGNVYSGSGCFFLSINDWKEDLCFFTSCIDECDIMQIMYLDNRIIWKREENKPKLTDDEKVILRNLPKEYKYIARDDNNELCVYSQKPTKNIIAWNINEVGKWKYLSVFNHLFQFIKWEDEEPYLISYLLEE